MVVSTVLLAYKLQNESRFDSKRVVEFVKVFISRLKLEVSKGLDYDRKFRYLIEFQRHLTQASVEKRAVLARATTLESQFEVWMNGGKITGEE